MIMMLPNALAPVFFVMGMGYHAGCIKRVDNTNVETLNLFLMRFALPSAPFTATPHISSVLSMVPLAIAIMVLLPQ